jgi:hypothetical protein
MSKPTRNPPVRRFLTEAEANYVRTGYRHMVDNGYGTLRTGADILRVMEIALIYAERELTIGRDSGFDVSENEVSIAARRQEFEYLASRFSAE